MAQDPAYGSRIRELLVMRATLQREKEAIGHNGVVVMQIRVAGAMDDVCMEDIMSN